MPLEAGEQLPSSCSDVAVPARTGRTGRGVMDRVGPGDVFWSPRGLDPLSWPPDHRPAEGLGRHRGGGDRDGSSLSRLRRRRVRLRRRPDDPSTRVRPVGPFRFPDLPLPLLTSPLDGCRVCDRLTSSRTKRTGLLGDETIGLRPRVNPW